MQVIPLSKTVGLIQWVDNTRSLQELVNFTLSKQEISQYDSICKLYHEWIEHASSSKKYKMHERYKEATVKYNASKVINKMNEFIIITMSKDLLLVTSVKFMKLSK